MDYHRGINSNPSNRTAYGPWWCTGGSSHNLNPNWNESGYYFASEVSLPAPSDRGLFISAGCGVFYTDTWNGFDTAFDTLTGMVRVFNGAWSPDIYLVCQLTGS